MVEQTGLQFPRVDILGPDVLNKLHTSIFDSRIT